MKNISKIDPVITFDHMHPDEKNSSGAEHRISGHVILFVLEIATVIALLGFMLLLMQ